MKCPIHVKCLFVIAVFFCAVLALTIYCAGESFAAPLFSRTDGATKEVLVAKDIGNGEDVDFIGWCGNNAAVYRGRNIGVAVVDFKIKERVQVSDKSDMPLNCSPDGRWVLYGSYGVMKTENEGDMAFDEYVKRISTAGDASPYIYRHEVATGRKERVGAGGIDEGAHYDALSPDGTKIIFGERNLFNSDIYVPEWQPVWFSSDQLESYEKRWFDDSSGVASYSHLPTAVCVEFFGETGWAKCFELDSGEVEISKLLLDGNGRIYFSIGVDSAMPSRAYSIYGCDIFDKALKCEKIIERDFDDYASPLGVLADGSFLLRGDGCILRAESLTAEGRCVADRFYDGVEYRSMHPIGISPDRKRLALYRSRGEESKVGDGRWVATVDLFVIDLVE